MKSILISIQPKWCELIASGKKTIEVRKTAPKLQTPFKCYIYCTQGNGSLNDTLMSSDRCHVLNGKVIGEFVCDRIDEFHEWQLSPRGKFHEEEEKDLAMFLKESCLSHLEVCAYRKNLPYYKPLYGIHITELVIYDKPKALSEFRAPCKLFNKRLCVPRTLCGEQKGICDGTKQITTAPQSWGYVEE